MSHITTLESVIEYKDTNTLTGALDLLAKEKSGLTILRENENKIVVRYKPIEKYRTKGNLCFVKENGVWKAQGDSHLCRDEFKAIVDRVATAYQEVGLKRILLQQQYTARVTATSADKVEMVGVKY